jgi:N-acetylmuramoyl-L-alanine amidase
MEKSKMKLIGKIVVFFLFFGGCSILFAAPKLRTVVIDAGHGGHDPGAVGKFAKEKDVNLAVALGLGKMIETHFSDVKVHYTRTTDTAVDLWRRPRTANQHKADLFISIHCNSSEHRRGMPYPQGFETFVMGLHKNAENLAVAQKENAAIFSEENYTDAYEGFNPNSTEAYIIFSLFQNAYLDQSLDFASRLQRHYANHIPSVCRGVKQAGFLVLHGATMPSVLTEIGFINNPEEEKFMTSPDGQEKIITALFNAFKEYKYAVDGFNNQSEVANATIHVTKPATESVSVCSQTPVTTENTNTSENNVEEKTTPKIVYKVQFASSSTDKSLTSTEFRNIETPGKYAVRQGTFGFTAGEFQTAAEAAALQRKMQSQGYRDAFVVVFKDDQRITTAEALRILQD